MSKQMLMVGFSTEQNTANLIPAVMHNVESFLLVETSRASKEKWSDGLCKVLESKNIRVLSPLSLSDSEVNDINKLSSKLLEKTKGEDVIWNLGGGQKPHNIAMWEAFKSRKDSTSVNIACYANQDSVSRKLENWYYDDNKLKCIYLTIKVNLSAKDILTTYNYEILKDNPPVFSLSEVNHSDFVKDLMKYPEFREFLFRIGNTIKLTLDYEKEYTIEQVKSIIFDKRHALEAKLKDFFNDKVNKLIENKQYISLAPMLRKAFIGDDKPTTGFILDLFKESTKVPNINIETEDFPAEIFGNLIVNQKLPLSHDVFNFIMTGKKNFATYFERVVSNRFLEIVKENPGKLVEVYENLEIRKHGIISTSGEYDILCVTEIGTLLAFDAKTFDFELKDADARLYNLEKAGGRYINFSVIMPFNKEDVNKSYFPKKLKDLPFALQQRNRPFYVISDGCTKDFYIRKENKSDIISILDQPVYDSVKCQLLDNRVTLK